VIVSRSGKAANRILLKILARNGKREEIADGQSPIAQRAGRAE
jgi:hypothetical protein